MAVHGRGLKAARRGALAGDVSAPGDKQALKALTRLAVVYDIPMALNASTADILIRHPGDFTSRTDRGEAA